MQVELPANLDAVYSNLVIIQHSPSEFVLDFARVLPNMPAARVGTRVVMTPMHAKLLLRALRENIERFEAQFGPIYLPQQGEALANQLFHGGQPAKNLSASAVQKAESHRRDAECAERT